MTGGGFSFPSGAKCGRISLAPLLASRVEAGDYVVMLGAGNITQWAAALPAVRQQPALRASLNAWSESDPAAASRFDSASVSTPSARTPPP